MEQGRVASVQEPRANSRWTYRPKTTEEHIRDAAKGTPSGLLLAGLKGASEKVQKELKNGLCDIVFAVGQMQENLPITVLDSTRRYGGLPVQVEDLTANLHRFIPSPLAPGMRTVRVPRSVCETAQHYLDETTRFLDAARKAFRELDASLLNSDSLLALIDASPPTTSPSPSTRTARATAKVIPWSASSFPSRRSSRFWTRLASVLSTSGSFQTSSCPRRLPHHLERAQGRSHADALPRAF